jgi:A/G-specific adenine glycosylase
VSLAHAPQPKPAPPDAGPTRDAELVGALSKWFHAGHRLLPWRTTPRNPYHALVAEAMLQQTQVARVEAYFNRFIARFPTVGALASAGEDDVLALWSGLGYYRRAKSLHAAARAIVQQYGGLVPADVTALQALPGVGRYTAGAISSIAFGQPAPIVDGNVARVLLRLDGQASLTSPAQIARWAWLRAEALVLECAKADADASGTPTPGPSSASRPKPSTVALFNEGLMELGATVCLPAPAQPACLLCPLRDLCVARAQGLQATIPPPKPSKATPTITAVCVVIADGHGRLLLEQRPQHAPVTGAMWAGLWQCPTLEFDGRLSKAKALAHARELAQLRGAEPLSVAPAGTFTHQTTHRLLAFHVLAAHAAHCTRKGVGRRWTMPVDLHELGVSSAAKRAIELGLARIGLNR